MANYIISFYFFTNDRNSKLTQVLKDSLGNTLSHWIHSIILNCNDYQVTRTCPTPNFYDKRGSFVFTYQGLPLQKFLGVNYMHASTSYVICLLWRWQNLFFKNTQLFFNGYFTCTLFFIFLTLV